MNIEYKAKKAILTVKELREFLYLHPEIPDNLIIRGEGCDCYQDQSGIEIDDNSFQFVR